MFEEEVCRIETKAVTKKEGEQSNSKLKLQGFSHVSFVVKCLEDSRRFYRDLLGFSELVRPGALQERGIDGCWLFNFGVGLHLIEGNPPERSKEIRPAADHFSFQCENIREVKAQLQTLNVKYISDEIEHEGFHISQLFFHDPDNYMIEICNCDSAPLLYLLL
mmetsp:Transcript_10458/g.28653  ORF Transcript_10458/g.28653 Transcript_10458/m.28653 type:complete len:163 (-) Transcript_10458:22-510(-)